MGKDFAGKAALITGGSRGIGKAIALELAAGGADIALCARTEGAAESAAAEIEALGVRAAPCQADVADSDQAAAAVAQTLEAFGRIDILVNNAGITRDNLLMRMKEEDWDAVLATNLKGAFNCCKAAVRPMMKARSGRIINVTSVAGISGNAGQANYAASKAGLLGLTKSLAKEFASRNITVNAVAPGLVPDTGMTSDLADQVVEQMQALIPLGRTGTVEEIAHAVTFLASERAGYITGQVVVVDGGMTM
jgi:3-oxoacyl-[acyl-carrier protein] reductase